MIRTQVQIPDDLYERAKRFSAAREMSLAEAVRRALELMLDRYPEEASNTDPWAWPTISSGGMLVAETALREVASDDETYRSRPDAGNGNAVG